MNVRTDRATLNVGVADMVVSNTPEVVIATYGLGSCVGLSLWDPVIRAGGILHYMLPLSRLMEGAKGKKPDGIATFGDTGIPALFRALYDLGAAKERLVVKAAGGSDPLGNDEVFRIGEKNVSVLRQVLARNGIRLAGESLGGRQARSLYLDVATGRTWYQTQGEKHLL